MNEDVLSRNEDDPKEQTIQSNISIINDLFGHFTTVIHTGILGYTIYMIYLCVYKNKWNLATWHALLFALSWLLFMTEGVLILAPYNLCTKYLSSHGRYCLHVIFLSLSMALALAGYLCIHIGKNKGGYPHLSSNHSISGLVALVLCIPTCLNGVMAWFSGKLTKWISGQCNAFIHGLSAILTLVVGGVSMLQSLNTFWWIQMTEDNYGAYILVFIILLLSCIWSIVRPLWTCALKLRQILKK